MEFNFILCYLRQIRHLIKQMIFTFFSYSSPLPFWFSLKYWDVSLFVNKWGCPADGGVESSLRITFFVLQLFSFHDLKCICLPAETFLLNVIRAEDLTAKRVSLSVFLLMQNLHVYYLCFCYGLQAQHECEPKIYIFIKERKVLSKNNMVNLGICKC